MLVVAVIIVPMQELEQELSEQRGLTKAIAQQGSRGRLHGQAQKDQPQPCTRYGSP